MTDAEFEVFMRCLDRLVDADKRGTTRLGARYQPRPDSTQSDHTSDILFHRYNDERTDK